MPTGYTSDISKGITFRQFALNCARAFGACVTMRDEPHDAKIPEEFKPSDYHQKRVAEVRDKIKKVQNMSLIDAEKEAKKQFFAEVKDKNDGIEKNAKLRKQYTKMLTKVNAWEPPSSDHVAFKKFMVDQIVQSIDFDCNDKYYLEKQVVQKTGQQWKEERLKHLLWALNYHLKEDIEEQERVSSRNTWIRKLRESLREE